MTLVIAGLLVVLVVSYGQVIAVHPDGGGAYAVAKKDLGPTVSLLAAASLVVDYVLTVTVSLAAGAASLASAFPALGSHLLVICLIGLALLTAVNLRGVAESARVLMLPTALFIVSILGIVVLGLLRDHPAAVVGTPNPSTSPRRWASSCCSRRSPPAAPPSPEWRPSPTACPPSANPASNAPSAPS